MKNFIKRILQSLRGEVSTERLIKMGLKVGRNFNRQAGCIIDYSHCWLITIGNDVTFAPRVHILAHDASTKKILGYTKIGKVNIEDNVFIGANSTILPSVSIGKGAIIGANSVVVKDIPSNAVAAGNPAKVICSVEEYRNRMQKLMREDNVFDEKWIVGNINNESKNAMNEILNKGIGFIK